MLEKRATLRIFPQKHNLVKMFPVEPIFREADNE